MRTHSRPGGTLEVPASDVLLGTVVLSGAG